jgi:hypothetical protein
LQVIYEIDLKKSVAFFGPSKTPKKTPQNAQKRPKRPKNARFGRFWGVLWGLDL